MKKKTFLSLFISAIVLTACNVKADPTIPIDTEIFNEIIPHLEIVDKDEIYGNIYLPEEVNGATITWTSSDWQVIDTDRDGDIAPGIVHRPKEETIVTLTAKVEIDGTSGIYKQNVTVMPLEYELTEDDYEGYLFNHFIGENGKDQEQIYFALAEDGLKFNDLNNKKPVLTSTVGEEGVRDPYIIRSPEGDSFYIIATNLSINNRGGWGNPRGQSASKDGSYNLILWKSHDLVEWGDPIELPVAPKNAGMAWAPEMIYNEEIGEYVIFFASSIVNEARTEKTKKDAIYYVTTRDFVHISETKLLIDNQSDPDGTPREIIDTTIIKIDDTYYSASKDGDNNVKNGGIRIMRTTDMLDSESWEKVCDLDELGLKTTGLNITAFDNGSLEGPEFFTLNKKDWEDPDTPEYCLMADRYMSNGGYFPLITTNIEDIDNSLGSYKVLDNSRYSFSGLKKRHGGILKITGEEIERLKEAYSN